MNAEVLEMIDGTYVIRAYGQEERMSQIFPAENRRFFYKKNIE